MRKIRLWAIVLAALMAFAGSAVAAQRVTANENTTNKTGRASSASSARSAAKKIDINSAPKSDLESLPGVGPTTADAIIAARPFKNVNDLKDVRGIGAARFDEIKPLVVARKSSSGTAQAATRGSASDKPTSDAQERNKTPKGAKGTAGSGGAVVTDNSADEPQPNRAASKTNPRRDDDRGSSAPSSRGSERSGKINLNTASLEELESLPEIGPVKAQAIIDARPFKSVDDVKNVKGIKDATLDEIRDQITVR